MKLSTKLLATLAPITGIIVPVTISCGCGSNNYVINYGDAVNCKDEKADGYKSLEDVQKAVRNKANKEPKHNIDDAFLNTINPCNTNEKAQMVYYDLIASYTIIDNDAIKLTGWTGTSGNPFTFTFDLETGSGSYSVSNVTITYEHENTQINLVVKQNNVVKIKHPSYQFSDCTYVQGE